MSHVMLHLISHVMSHVMAHIVSHVTSHVMLHYVASHLDWCKHSAGFKGHLTEAYLCQCNQMIGCLL